MSYVFEGLKWGGADWGTPSGLIEWTVDWSGLASGSYTATDIQALNDALIYAFNAWEDVAAVTFSWTSDPAAAEVSISFDPLTGGIVGQAGGIPVGWTGGDPYVVTDMYIQFDSMQSWDPGAGSGLDLYAVALHEIGHVLGLDHTTDATQIMYPYVTDTAILGSGDIYGVQYIYGLDGSDVAVPDPGRDPGSYDPEAASSGGSDGGAASSFGLLAVLIGLLLTLVTRIGSVGAAATAALRLDDDPDHHHGETAGHGDDMTSAAEQFAAGTDLADFLPVTETLGDEAWPGNDDEPDDAMGVVPI